MSKKIYDEQKIKECMRILSAAQGIAPHKNYLNAMIEYVDKYYPQVTSLQNRPINECKKCHHKVYTYSDIEKDFGWMVIKGVKKPWSYCKQCLDQESYKSRIFLTSDIHGSHEFCKQMENFCEAYNTTKDDILIVSGDAGINYHCNEQDNSFKHKLSQLPITFLVLHGNHEERAWNVQGYENGQHKVGQNYITAYQQLEYPNLLFLSDYQSVNLNNKKFLFLGGAYSVDKYYRLLNHAKWFASEQISPQDRKKS